MEEEEKARIQKEMSSLHDRLSKLNESLARKIRAREEYDKTISESEQAYMKILESSNTLLQVLKKERDTLGKKKTTHT
jgi:Sjoegren syndrome nuclear autoantigen 1